MGGDMPISVRTHPIDPAPIMTPYDASDHIIHKEAVMHFVPRCALFYRIHYALSSSASARSHRCVSGL